MANSNRTALLIRCSREEADRIRAAAKRQKRTLSAYVLRALTSRLDFEAQMEKSLAAMSAQRSSRR